MTAEIREALVIGINYYPFLKDKKTKNPLHLPKAAADAEAIAQILEEYGNFRVQRLPEIHIDGSRRVDASAKNINKQALEKAIENLFTPPSKTIPDTALLFFAGHGLQSTESNITEGFLATSEANPTLGKLGLSMHWLQEILQKSPVRRQIIWLDCCHSGELLNFTEGDPDSQGNARDRCFIAASRDFELADEQVGGEHGVLTGALLEALNPENYAEGLVTNYSLTDYIKKQLQKSRQQPVFHNSGSEVILTGLTEKIDRAVLLAAKCPYKGLESFDFNDEDAKYFRGRTKLTNKLLDKLKDGNFLAVVGASGSGKSSVVKAGLLYQLKLGQYAELKGSENWPILIFRPGKKPLDNLAAALATRESELSIIRAKESLANGANGLVELVKSKLSTNSGTDLPRRLVLVVDQFEESFTLCNDEDRKKFFDCILGALNNLSDRLIIILNMQLDFLGKCTEQDYTQLYRLMQENLVPVPPMSQEELKQAITEPAELGSLEIQRELVDQMLNDVENSPGILPLLQYTLTELWQRRQVNRLTLVEYTSLGGVKGTLQKRANEIYYSLSPEEQNTAKRIFLELTQLGEGTEDTRRQIFKSDLINETYKEKVVEDVLNKLVESRLIVTSKSVLGKESNQTETIVDVAHEALIRNWPELRKWVDEYRIPIKIERKIEAAAEEWKNKEKSKDYLLKGLQLAEAENYLKEYDRLGFLADWAKEFVNESIKQAQFNYYRNIGIVGGVMLVLLGLVLTNFIQRQEAENRKENAQILLKTLSAKDKFFSSNLELEGLIDALKAGQKLKQQNSPQTDTKMQVVTTLEQIYYQIAEYNRLIEHTNDVNSVSISPDGKIVASGSADKTIKLWSIPEGKKIASLSEHSGAVNSVSFSPDGKTLASASSDNTIKIWNIAENKVIFTLQGHSGEVKNVSFSPDGKTLASASSDKTIKIWDIATGKEIASLSGHNDAVNSVSFSPDGKTLASASSDKTIKIWDIATGKEIATLSGHSGAVNSVSFSPDGKTIASASTDKTIKIWDIAKREIISTIPAHKEGVLSLAWSWDGKTLASGSYDNTIKLWKVPEGKEIATLKGHNNWVNSISISRDGKTLVSGSSQSIYLQR